MKAIDEIGNRYGKLVVVARAESDKYGVARWRCICDCGKETISRGYNLRCGSTRSCGCAQRNNFTPEMRANRQLAFGEAAFHRALRRMKVGATERGYQWRLTDKQVRELTSSPCYYCGVEPSNVSKDRYGTGEYRYNGIDRVDNSEGYLLNNVVACCFDCNKAKGTKSQEQFIDWLKRIAKFWGEKGTLRA